MANNQVRFLAAMEHGRAFNEAGNWSDALRAFRAAVAEYPQNPAALAGLGEACFGLKQYDRALDCYKLAARHSKGDITYMRKVADLQERLGSLAEASRTYLATGEIYLRLRRLEDALANWERAIRLDANLLAAHQRLASVFQRRGDTKRAVREYLAIARILQMRGEPEKALRMALAAQRLDPDSKDVEFALELIHHGEQAFAEEEVQELEPSAPEPEPPVSAPDEDDALSEALRQMATVLEAERRSQAPPAADVDPVEAARRQAHNDMAEEIFRDEEDEDALYGIGAGSPASGLSKLERDALIGQGMDSQLRGQLDDAITCYARAIAGGLRLPAAYFTVGLLLGEKGRMAEARRALEIAGRDQNYREASRLALARLG